MSASDAKKLQWMVDTPALLKEMVEGNPSGGALVQPVNIFKSLLGQVAARAIELDDPKMNELMLRLALYECPPDKRVAAVEQAASDALHGEAA